MSRVVLKSSELCVTRENVELPIKTPDFWPKKEDQVYWDFIYAGKVITARIIDQKFIARINNYARFGKWDTLIVDLKIHYRVDFRTTECFTIQYDIVQVRAFGKVTLKHNSDLKLEDLDQVIQEYESILKMPDLTKNHLIKAILQDRLNRTIAKLTGSKNKTREPQ